MIYIYGASDDLVEIEGDVSEEFNPPYDEPMYVATSSGFVVRIMYGESGEWEVRMKWVPAIWKSQFTVYPAGSELAQKYADNDYSDVVYIDVDTDWVVGGTQWVKRVES